MRTPVRRLATAAVAVGAGVLSMGAPAQASVAKSVPWNTKSTKAYPKVDMAGIKAWGGYVKNGGDLYLKGTLEDTTPKDGYSGSVSIDIRYKNGRGNSHYYNLKGSKVKNFSFLESGVAHVWVLECGKKWGRDKQLF